MGPAAAPESSEMQFEMDLDGAAGGGAGGLGGNASAGREGSARRPDAAASAAASARSRGSRESRRPSVGAQERAEKKPRLSANSSAGSTPMSVSPVIRPAGAPSVPSSSALIPLDAEVQPATAMRGHEFQVGRRVFHVHFGHGYIGALERQVPAGSTDPPEQERVLTSRTHNMRMVFDSAKYKELRLRAFYAVPKMVVIPSASALLRRKRQHSEAPPVNARVAWVKELLGRGGAEAGPGLRLACEHVRRWSLEPAFDTCALVRRLVEGKQFAAALRFAREFQLRREFPTTTLLHAMLAQKRYDGALKACGARCRSVDGEAGPGDVLRMMVRAGEHCVALKYVHKFGQAAAFPPAQLVRASLQGDLSVRTAAMLLKYVPLFELSDAFPREAILERAAASGILVHELAGGKLVLKGRRRSDSASLPPGAAVPVKVGSAPN